MGSLLCVSRKRTERTLNHSPDEQQQSVKRSNRRKKEVLVRFFMTGMGSAGKTTIVRQLHLLCKRNPAYKLCDQYWREVTPDAVPANAQRMENAVWARRIRQNCLDVFDLLIKHIGRSGEFFDSEENREFAEYLEELCEEGQLDECDWEELGRLRNGITALLQDEAIKSAYKRRNKIEVDGRKLFDGCDYFLEEERINEIFRVDYTPTDEAMVHSRNPTADMRTYRFKLNDTRIEITDVGGQRSELMKIVDYLRHWSFNCGDDPQTQNFILLVVGMSDYNVRHERYEGTLLDECVEYTKVLLNNRIAQNCGLLIFFNKKDRFKEKLMDAECREDISHLARHLASKSVKQYLAKGKFVEHQMADALAAKFVEAIEEIKDRERSTYCRFTCAIDSKMMEGIFSAIKDDIINENLFSLFP